jgi:hypothetical protein
MRDNSELENIMVVRLLGAIITMDLIMHIMYTNDYIIMQLVLYNIFIIQLKYY